MTDAPRCKTCRFYQPGEAPRQWLGWCTIDLPPWLLQIAAPDYSPGELNRTVRHDSRCSLHSARGVEIATEETPGVSTCKHCGQADGLHVIACIAAGPRACIVQGKTTKGGAPIVTDPCEPRGSCSDYRNMNGGCDLCGAPCL